MNQYTQRVLTIGDAMAIQNNLNELTQTNWINILTKDHFKTQMIMEINELVDGHIDYKWWKKSNNELDYNAKIEVIDILHFALSVILIHDNAVGFNNRPHWSSVWSFNDQYSGEHRLRLVDHNNHLNYQSYIKLMKAVCDEDIDKVMYSLICLTQLNSEEISAYFVAKNELNAIRQQYGYKQGTYKKEKNGQEDNEVMEYYIDGFFSDENRTLDQLKDDIREHLVAWQLE